MPIVVDRLRDNLRAASGRWRAGQNAFTAMTAAERREYLAYDPGPDELSLKRREAVARLTRLQSDTVPPLRSTVDLRSHHGKMVVPPVGDRSAHGMRDTVATVITSTLRMQRNDASLSVEIPVLESDAPGGRAWLSAPKPNHSLRVTRRGSTGSVSVLRWHEMHTRTAMKQWIATHGALLAVLAVHEDLFAYAGGVYHYIAGALEGGHCVAMIGYDEQSWFAQNTWGHGWGEQGCFRTGFGERGIDASMWGVELR